MASTATHQFDNLANIYEDMVTWPFRRDIEVPSVLDALGDVHGKDVLDFGCGEGTYSRLLKARGAHRVVGYDLAEGMLRHARETEEKEPRGIEFTSSLSEALDHRFDLVLGVYVLPYAQDERALFRMCADMGRLLKPGGRLVTLPIHPEFEPRPDYYEPYGFRLASNAPRTDGAEVKLDLFYSNHDAHIVAWYWSAPALDRAMEQAGFSTVVHRNPMPPGLIAPEQAPQLLQAYLRKPHAVILDCRYGPPR